MIYLVRHGQSEWNLARRTQGQTPHPPLTARGRDDAARAAQAIEADRARRHDRSAVTLLTSDLVRARQTADIIGARLWLNPRVDARLREQALGWLEGRGVDEAVASTADTNFCDPDASIGGGESARDVYERMAAVLGELCPDQTTIVVSHGDALRYALGWATGKPAEDCGWVEFSPGSVAAVEGITAPRWLRTRRHLPGAGGGMGRAPHGPGALLVTGTTSDAGKSIVTTGLCRAFARRGIQVAPFKAQNMSNNSMVCRGRDGQPAEIGRAQWVQALAAGVPPEAAMNPVLLKPGSDHRSHVVLLGQPAGTVTSADWDTGRRHLARAAHAAYDELASRFEVVLAEGAGSPTEINLRGGDFVNMGLARHTGMPTVVVGDIDRGGVFAAFYGTVALLDSADQALVAGFVVNKFRGDARLLAPGLARIETLTGRRVYGVLPWDPALWLDSEDALDLEVRRSAATALRRVAVVRLPRISNFTDVDALGVEPDLDVVFASAPRDIADADLVVLPGTRATLADLAWVRSRGLADAIIVHARRGRPVLGICGGFQMLGREINDRYGVEGPAGTAADALGLLDVRTDFAERKTLGLPTGTFRDIPVAGYEIHHGLVTADAGLGDFPGGARAGPVFGTMWHGSLEGDRFRGAFLAEALNRAPSQTSFPAARQARLDRLADLVEDHLDVAALVELARSGAPAGLPTLPPRDAA